MRTHCSPLLTGVFREQGRTGRSQQFFDVGTVPGGGGEPDGDFDGGFAGPGEERSGGAAIGNVDASGAFIKRSGAHREFAGGCESGARHGRLFRGRAKGRAQARQT